MGKRGAANETHSNSLRNRFQLFLSDDRAGIEQQTCTRSIQRFMIWFLRYRAGEDGRRILITIFSFVTFVATFSERNDLKFSLSLSLSTSETLVSLFVSVVCAPRCLNLIRRKMLELFKEDEGNLASSFRLSRRRREDAEVS